MPWSGAQHVPIGPLTPQEQESYDGELVLYLAVALLCQTLVYGIFAAFTPFSTYRLIKRGFRGRFSKVILASNLTMFSLCTAYWAITVAVLAKDIQVFFIHQIPAAERTFNVSKYQPVLSAILLINFVVSDAVVLWRAYVICQELRVILMISFGFLVLTLLTVLATIGIRLGSTIIDVRRGFEKQNGPLETPINVLQLSTAIFSFVSNVIATGAIGWKWRKYEKDVRSNIHDQIGSSKNTAGNVLSLLIESGAVYCLSGLIFFIADFVALPYDTLRNVYFPVHVQLAGIYPSLVFAMVHSRSESSALQSATGVGGSSVIGSDGRFKTKEPSNRGRLEVFKLTEIESDSEHERRNSTAGNLKHRDGDKKPMEITFSSRWEDSGDV